MSSEGIVVGATGSFFSVHDALGGRTVECRIRGKLRLKGARSTSPVVVGDRVDFEVDATGQALITAIHPRRNYVIRRSPNLSRESHIIAANVDQAVVLATLFSPVTSYEFIDRFLVTCQAYRIPATVVLGKADLLEAHPEAVAAFHRNYTSAGYRVIDCSCVTGAGLEALRELLTGKTTLLSGNSGVGKSTLIRTLCPGAQVVVGDVSSAHHKGRHTTTHSTAWPLDGEGWLIDTPGIKGFGLLDIADEELYMYFPEILHASQECRFANCTHTHEPGCAVMAAVKAGTISPLRYESYLKILLEDSKYR